VIWDKGVGVILVFLDDEMALFTDLLIVLPVDGAPPEFGEEGMIPVPRLKVEGTPHAAFLGPNGAHALEYVATCIEGRIDALETLVVFLDLLWGDQREGGMNEEGTDLEGLAKFLSGAKLDGGYMPETGPGEETVGVGQRDGVLSELHGVQPVSQVLDLGGGEEEAGFKVLEGANVELHALDAILVQGVVFVHDGVLGEEGLEGAAIEGIGECLMPVWRCEGRGGRGGETSVPFKEDVCVAIVASDHRRDHLTKPQNGNTRWRSTVQPAMAQTVQKRKRPQPDDDNNASSAPPKRSKPSTARKSTGAGPPVASSSRDKHPREQRTPPHNASSNPPQASQMPASSLLSARSAAIVPARSHFARFASTSAAPTSSSESSLSLASCVTLPSLSFLALTPRVEHTGSRNRPGYDDRHQLSDGRGRLALAELCHIGLAGGDRGLPRPPL